MLSSLFLSTLTDALLWGVAGLRRKGAVEEWMRWAEEAVGQSLLEALLQPVELLDTTLHSLTLLRDAALPGSPQQ
eukprot:1932749-Rhodomonas_salina.2